jgi:hypothetical protein
LNWGFDDLFITVLDENELMITKHQVGKPLNNCRGRFRIPVQYLRDVGFNENELLFYSTDERIFARKNLPTLFTLKDTPQIFKVVNKPYTFKATMENGKLILDSNGRNYYLLTVVEVVKSNSLIKDRVGFLLLNTTVFEQARKKYIISKGEKDLIFVFNQFGDCVFINPTSKQITESIQKKIDILCSNPEKFIQQFRTECEKNNER